MYKKGFTLIELLVVIAIIGILSGIVLTSLGTARNKAKASSATASMASMRAQAELGVDASGNYLSDVCSSTATGGLGALIAAVENQTGSNTVTCNPSSGATNEWAASVDLSSLGGTSFCVDSSGFSGPGTLGSGDTACTAGASATPTPTP